MPKGVYPRRLPIKRFMNQFVKQPTGCWEWQACLSTTGYGMFSIKHQLLRAHRFAYEFFNNTSISEGLEIDHLCRNLICVNPDHLEAVTHRENINRGRSFNREKTHCLQGHPYDNSNTGINKGRRYCRTCSREKTRRRRAKSQGLAC